MQKEIASHIILSQLRSLRASIDKDNIPLASLNHIQLWIIPQKAEHDDKYDINRGYFELLVQEILHDLIVNGYIKSCYPDDAEEDEQSYFLLLKKE
jgi:hypothetical protein